jgi:ketosteroid isomerase-like protein
VSQENVDIVKASFEAWNAGDMEAWGNFLAPDVLWRQPPDWPEPGPYIGRDTVLRQIEVLRETWDADTAEPIGDFVHGADRVVVRFVWRGRAHGPAFDWGVTCVYTVREGRISAFEFFRDHAEALEVAGLSEHDSHA